MAMRFVRPNVVRVDLGDGDWVDLKKELTAGEARQMLRDAHVERPDGTFALNPANASMARLLSYLVGWSLRTETGIPVPVTADTLDALDVQSFARLLSALDAHEAAQRPPEAEATSAA